MKRDTMALYKLSLVLLTCYLACNCAGTAHHRQKIMEEQINAITAKEAIVNPPIVLTVEKFKFSSEGRGLASVVERRPSSSSNLGPVGMTNKVLYFSTLYFQYQEFARFTQSAVQSLSFCPNFHSHFIQENSRVTLPKMTIPTSSLTNLPLPVPQDLYPEQQLLRLNTPDLAIREYLAAIYQEIEELCQTGSSSNYYVFENLVQANNQISADGPSLKKLNINLKTTLFSNFAILLGLHALVENKLSVAIESNINANSSFNYTASSNLNDRIVFYYKAISERTGTPWMEEYYGKIGQRNNHLN